MTRLTRPRSLLTPTALSLMLLTALSLIAACAPPVPRAIQDEMARTPPGQVTLVVFSDFQCPFCRRTHAALEPVLARHRGRVRVVLRHVPLPRHPDARTAARAAVCGEALGARGLADALFRSPSLSEAACERLAVARGADPGAFERCVRDPATDARINHDIALFDSLGGDGVPLMFVGRRRLEGARTSRDLEAAVAAALER